MQTILEQQQRLEMEILATTGYVAILRSHLHQIKHEIAREVKGIQAAYEDRHESAGGKVDALHRLSRKLEVQRELDSRIQSYETLHYKIDKLLEELERAMANMEATTGRMAEGARAM